MIADRGGPGARRSRIVAPAGVVSPRQFAGVSGYTERRVGGVRLVGKRGWGSVGSGRRSTLAVRPGAREWDHLLGDDLARREFRVVLHLLAALCRQPGRKSGAGRADHGGLGQHAADLPRAERDPGRSVPRRAADRRHPLARRAGPDRRRVLAGLVADADPAAADRRGQYRLPGDLGDDRRGRHRWRACTSLHPPLHRRPGDRDRRRAAPQRCGGGAAGAARDVADRRRLLVAQPGRVQPPAPAPAPRRRRGPGDLSRSASLSPGAGSLPPPGPHPPHPDDRHDPRPRISSIRSTASNTTGSGSSARWRRWAVSCSGSSSGG